MKVLHLCSDYAGTPLYRDLVESLDRMNIQQIIYIPVRSPDMINKYVSTSATNAVYHFPYILNPYLRLNFFRKISKIAGDVKSRIDKSTPDIVHAHFLFSDGGVAYKLKKDSGLDYIVTVRNTDINVFFKYMIHLRKFGLQILINARNIIFLSSTYKSALLNRFIPSEYHSELEAKSLIIPNGLNNFWLENISLPKTINRSHYSLIYIGEFSKNKNIPSIIKVTDSLIARGYNVQLIIIGQYGNNVREIQKLVTERENYIQSIPKIDDKQALLGYYRNSDIFLMPSFYETFGLVYLEAMSQGLPVIYTKGQGFSGYYADGEVGYAVSPSSTDEITGKIEMIIDNYGKISENCVKEVRNFTWEHIASRYAELYSKIV